MKQGQLTIAGMALLAAPAFGQEIDTGELQRRMAELQSRAGELALSVPRDLNENVAALRMNLDRIRISPLQGMHARSTPGNREEGEYDAGTRALDDRRYDDAIRHFGRALEAKGSRSEGALYWKAYALNRLGRRDDALAVLASLRKDYPGGRWSNDAQALEVEVKQGSNSGGAAAQDSNEDIKLMAINGLMAADPDRAIPLLDNILKGNASPKVKDRALFVLTQNRSAKAQQVLTDFAKGSGNPDVQMRAIRYIGMAGTAESQKQLASIYSSSSDVAVKKSIIRSLMISKGKDQLFELAKNEKNPDLRLEAIRQLGVMRSTNELAQLYAGEQSADNKIEIIRALFVAGAGDKLLDLARNEKDMRIRSEAIRNLAISQNTTPGSLASLYSADMDPKVKREVVNGLFMRGDAKSLVDLARKEQDPQMKRRIVEQLSMMRNNKEATDYMMEILK